jgi:RNA polymerase sigma-70 factor (ECF subfamily)
MRDSVEELCSQAQAGQMSAASELVTLFYQKIFAYFRRLAGNEHDAADLTQRTFCKAWSSLARFQRRSSFSTWLHGIAHHVYADWRRQRNFAEPVKEEWWETCADDAPSPFEDAAERDTASRLYALVERLDDESREAVHLHYYQGQSLAETAEVLNVPLSTLKYRLRGALDFLRTQAADPKIETIRFQQRNAI